MNTKRALTLILAFLILHFPLALGVSAAETGDTILTDVLKETNRDLIADVLASDKLPESLQNVELDGQPMLVVFNLYFHAYADRSYEDIISRAMEEPLNLYILCQEPILLRVSSDKSSVGVVYDTEPLPAYVQDIVSGSAVQTFLGQSATVSNILCFDASSSWLGTTVVYETDKGRFVRIYEESIGAVSELAYDDFIKHAKTYHEYTTSFSANLDAPSGRTSFAEYLKFPEKYGYGRPAWEKYLPWIVVVGIVAIFLVWRYLKKRKRPVSAE